jgi:hypothetical protein
MRVFVNLHKVIQPYDGCNQCIACVAKYSKKFEDIFNPINTILKVPHNSPLKTKHKPMTRATQREKIVM